MTQQGRAMRGIFINEKDGIKAPSFDGTQPCAQTDPELFFPDTAGASVKGKQIVKRICAQCEFQTPCLEYALENDVFGTWGGMLESERRAIKRRRRMVS